MTPEPVQPTALEAPIRLVDPEGRRSSGPKPDAASPLWHVLDVRAIWIREFARALAADVPVLGWRPRLSRLGALRSATSDTVEDDIRVRLFPLQSGFARPPVSLVLDESRKLDRLLRAAEGTTAGSPLVLQAPHYHRLAARWQGPVVYYATDMFRYYGEPVARIDALERSMIEAADLVCPNSARIAQHFLDDLGADPAKVVVVPNATRAANLLPEPPTGPAPLPADAADLPRPVAGVIGNLAANMDWRLLRAAVDATPWLSWLFVGPPEGPCLDADEERARADLLARGGRVRFVGWKHYSELAAYARALDVAVLPYRKREPTYSGSSTRFYEHLAACRPILATRGFEELLHKEPLLALVDSPDDLVARLKTLFSLDFDDGLLETRWKASQSETWEARAATMRREVARRGGAGSTG